MDAKVIHMIDDLSRGACMELLGHPITEEHSHHYLISVVHQQYEAKQLTDTDIILAWEDDHEDD